MEISAYFTALGEEVAVSIHTNLYKINYLAVTPIESLPPPPPGYIDSPFTRAIFHAFSLQEKSKWK